MAEAPPAPEVVAEPLYLDDVDDVGELDDSFGMSLYGSAFAPTDGDTADGSDAGNVDAVSDDIPSAVSREAAEASDPLVDRAVVESPAVEVADGSGIPGEAADFLADISLSSSGNGTGTAVGELRSEDAIPEEGQFRPEEAEVAPADAIDSVMEVVDVAAEPEVVTAEPALEPEFEPAEAVVEGSAEAAAGEPAEDVAGVESEADPSFELTVEDAQQAPAEPLPEEAIVEEPVFEGLSVDAADAEEPAPEEPTVHDPPVVEHVVAEAGLPTFELSDHAPAFPDFTPADIGPAEEENTNILGYHPVVSGLPPSSEAFAASQDEIARLAFESEFDLLPVDEDQGVATADLVDEAVATYEEQHAEDINPELVVDDGLMATLPELAKVLIGGGRVSLEDIESVMEEHEQTGQSVARILSTRNW